MKILLVSVRSEKSHGGIAVWTERFLGGCPSHAIECDLVNTEMIGKRQTQAGARRNLVDEIVRSKRIFSDLKKKLKEKDVKYDAAHLNTSCGSFGLFRDYIVAKKIVKRGIRLITHFHCDIPFWITNPINKYFLGKLVRLSNERLVLCENSREYLERNFSASSVKMPNFIEDTLVSEIERHYSGKVRKAFFVGRVEIPKGAKEIYELARRFPDIEFELVGSVDSVIASWDKPENVTLPGGMPHEQVIEHMDGADIFVFPSHTEGFSMALTEAMARGLPSVATDVGANKDMLD